MNRKCMWCEKPVNPAHTGRTKKYCSNQCRQRAYESRKSGMADIWRAYEGIVQECYLCGEALDWDDRQGICLDHVIATVRGGRTDIDNLKPVHVLCNAKKGSSIYVG